MAKGLHSTLQIYSIIYSLIYKGTSIGRSTRLNKEQKLAPLNKCKPVKRNKSFRQGMSKQQSSRVESILEADYGAVHISLTLKRQRTGIKPAHRKLNILVRMSLSFSQAR